MKFKRFTILIFVLAALPALLFSQSNRGNGLGTISGKVLDFDSKAPIEYANVIVFNSKDSSQITGNVSGKSGDFIFNNLPEGNFYVDVQFIGYQKNRITNISVSISKKEIDLGNIFLKPAAINIQDVVVQGERNPISYQIDKKVIDVSKLPTTISGNAADVLENVPSVSVDIDGNVSLRGSTNFTVLVDGRPSVMEAQDALQQIPATSIESIEIITNPSAKYDPEGTAGIINIKLKKNRNLGLSGIANANAGANDKYGGDFLFQYKNSDYNYNFGMNFNRRFFPGSGREEKQFLLGDNTSYLNSSGDREWGRIALGLRGGVDINLSENDLLTLGGRYGTRDNRNNQSSYYSQWSDLEPEQIFYLNKNNGTRDGSFFALNFSYLKKFNEDGHQVTNEFFLSRNNSDESAVSSSVQGNIQTDGKKTTETGPSTHFRGKIDYTFPFSQTGKFEAGSQGELEKSDESNGLYEFNPATSSFEFQSLYSHSIKSNISDLAIYSIYLNEWDNLGFQGGIRTEYTYRTIRLMDNNQNFSVDRWDFFPSFHASYKFGAGTQLMASYTRRIDRPHGWNLEPFLTWIDPNNVRMGNPDLQPEFIDSYEFGFQTFFANITFNNDLYYRVNHNRIDWVRSAYAENITLNTFANVGTDYSLGSEFMITMNPIEFWDISLMGDLYDYRIKGVLNDIPYERTSFNWSTRFNNGFNISKTTQLQFNLRYNSPSVSSQGRYEGFFTTDAAVKQDLMEKRISLTLQLRDLFKTGKREFTSQGIDFRSYTYFTREAPVVMLNLRFNFNNYKDKDKEQNNGEQDNGIGTEEY